MTECPVCDRAEAALAAAKAAGDKAAAKTALRAADVALFDALHPPHDPDRLISLRERRDAIREETRRAIPRTERQRGPDGRFLSETEVNRRLESAFQWRPIAAASGRYKPRPKPPHVRNRGRAQQWVLSALYVPGEDIALTVSQLWLLAFAEDWSTGTFAEYETIRRACHTLTARGKLTVGQSLPDERGRTWPTYSRLSTSQYNKQGNLF